MNQSELHKAFNNFTAKDQFKRKLKIFLGIGCLGMVLVGGLILWAGVATVQQAAKIVTYGNPAQVENRKGRISEIPAISRWCWENVQSLMTSLA